MKKLSIAIFGNFKGMNALLRDFVHLMELEKNHELLVAMGQLSRAYAEAYLSPESMARQLLSRCKICVE